MSASAKGPFCPSCKKPATGNFCQACGTKLGGRFCNQCGAQVGPAARFCNQCGAKAEEGGVKEAANALVGGQNLAWWLAGAAMFALIVVVGLSMVQSQGPSAPAAASAPGVAGGASAPGSGTPPDLSSMTPREAADRLFDRVMRTASAGDSAGAQAFLPMAIGAYERAQPLDHDGLFHLALLQRTALQLEESLETAKAVLAEDPDHVLALDAAAQAARELGRDEEAGEYYRRLLQVYDAQVARALPEYDMHAPIMSTARANAEAFLAGR